MKLFDVTNTGVRRGIGSFCCLPSVSLRRSFLSPYLAETAQPNHTRCYETTKNFAYTLYYKVRDKIANSAKSKKPSPVVTEEPCSVASYHIDNVYTPWVKKTRHQTLVHIFTKYWPIFLNSLIVKLSRKFAIKRLLQVTPHLKGHNICCLPYVMSIVSLYFRKQCPDI